LPPNLRFRQRTYSISRISYTAAACLTPGITAGPHGLFGRGGPTAVQSWTASRHTLDYMHVPQQLPKMQAAPALGALSNQAGAPPACISGEVHAGDVCDHCGCGFSGPTGADGMQDSQTLAGATGHTLHSSPGASGRAPRLTPILLLRLSRPVRPCVWLETAFDTVPGVIKRPCWREAMESSFEPGWIKSSFPTALASLGAEMARGQKSEPLRLQKVTIASGVTPPAGHVAT
jgi:hypothetical protein